MARQLRSYFKNFQYLRKNRIGFWRARSKTGNNDLRSNENRESQCIPD